MWNLLLKILDKGGKIMIKYVGKLFSGYLRTGVSCVLLICKGKGGEKRVRSYKGIWF